MKVEIFCNDDIASLQDCVNKFIENKELVDIKYSTSWNKIDKCVDFSVMIIYKT
jgi:hypothetical protein